MGHLVQMAGLAVQNFVSAAVGIAVAVALVRGFARKQHRPAGQLLGRPGPDRGADPAADRGGRARSCSIAGGAIQNLSAGTDVHTLAGATQHITGGPVASQEAIKELGTNGGGFYNANCAHPFENPTSWTNWLEIFLLLVISFSLPRTFGRMVGSNRQGYAIVAAMAIMAIGSVVDHQRAAGAARAAPCRWRSAPPPRAPRPASACSNSATFAASTTLTSTGAVDSFHDSYTALGGGITIFNMMLGEVAPGGTGSGLYGILILAVITVFVAGLMVGPHPGVPGQEDRRPRDQVRLAVLPDHADPRAGRHRGRRWPLPGGKAGMLNTGAHGLSEVLYAFTSATNNNGSAFAGLTVSTHLVQHRARAVHAARPVPADGVRARPGRFAGQAEAGARVRRHAAHLPAAVRRHARRRHA